MIILSIINRHSAGIEVYTSSIRVLLLLLLLPATNCMEMVDIMLNNYDIAPKVIFAATRGPMGEI